MVIGRRRRRRPRWLLVGGVLTVFVLALSAIASGDGEPSQRLAELAYVDEMRPEIERSTEQGADVAAVMDKAPELGRDGITRRLERVRREATEVLRNVEAGEPPPSLEAAHHLLVSTMYVRSRAAGIVAEAFNRALGTESPRPAVEAMAAAGGDLVTADRTYAVFARSLPERSGPADLLPPSQWVTDPERWSELQVQALITSLRSSEILAPVHDLSIVVMKTEPDPVGTEGDALILPPANTLRVHVVVANVGNEAEKEVPVVATLVQADGESDTARQFVDLEPGQRVTVTLGGLVPVSGQRHELSVRVGPLSGEAAVADNELLQALLVR